MVGNVQFFILVAALSVAGCERQPTTRFGEIAPAHFEKAIEASWLAECQVGRERPVRIDRASGVFQVEQRPVPDRMLVDGIKYDVLLSNDLIEDYVTPPIKSLHVKYYDALNRPDRIGLRGWVWRGAITCPRITFPANFGGFIFLEDYGSPRANNEKQSSPRL